MTAVTEETVKAWLTQVQTDLQNQITANNQRLDMVNKSGQELQSMLTVLQSKVIEAGLSAGPGRGGFDFKGAADSAPEVWESERGKIAFPEFADAVMNWASTLHPSGSDLLTRWSRPREDEDGQVLSEIEQEISRRLYQLLFTKTRDHAKTIVKSVDRPQGWKAWQEMHTFYSPRMADNKVADFDSLMTVTQAKGAADAQIAIAAWLSKVREYEAAYTPIAEEFKICTLKKIMPAGDFTQAIRGRKFQKFQDMLDEAKRFLADRPFTSKTPKKSDGPSPMEIGEMMTALDALIKGKGKGGYGKSGYKGKGIEKGGKASGDTKGGKPKGKGKGQDGRDFQDGKGFQGECWTCKRKGHRAADCPDWWKNANELSQDDWTQAEKDEEEEDVAEIGEDDDGEDELFAALEAEEEVQCGYCGDVNNQFIGICCDNHANQAHATQKCHVQAAASFPKLTDKKKAENPKMKMPKMKKIRKVRWQDTNWLGQDVIDKEINALPNEQTEEFEVVEASVDSGAADNVTPAGKFPQFDLVPSKMSIAGKGYVSASKHRVRNLGERVVAFKTDENKNKRIKFQEADVGKVLISVDKLVEAGNEVNLTKKNPHIKNIRSGEITKLRRKRGQFILHMHVRKNTSDFTRQGS